MKELSTAEKAKRYDEILARATGAYLPYYTEDIMTKVREFVDYLIPELKESKESEESEDERIKKAIKYGLDYVFTNNTTVYETTKEQCLAWLEKQGEQKPNKVEPKFKVGDKVKKGYLTYTVEDIDEDSYKLQAYSKNGDKGCTVFLTIGHEKDYELVEQKPAEWTHKDGKNLAELWEILSVHRNTNPQVDNLMEWVKDLVSYKRQEWSEEDEYCIHQLIVFCENCMIPDSGAKRCAHWLKYLKGRFTWKPSDKQMKALEHAINCYSGISPTNTEEVYTLEIMKEQLKKLRKE